MQLDPRNQRTIWRWYKRQRRGIKIGIWLGTLILLLMICSLISTAMRSGDGGQSSSFVPFIPAQVVIPRPTTGQVGQATANIPSIHTTTPTPTATHELIPSSTPTPTFTPTPTPVLTPTPTPGPHLSITFTALYAVDYLYGKISVQTLPKAALTVAVTYCSGERATNGSLKGTSYADDNGNYTWYYTPMTTCRGPATADVTAELNGDTISNSGNFKVK